MTETMLRLKAAWYALRGWGVIRGVHIYAAGEVFIVRRKTFLGSDSSIEQSLIFTTGPVKVTGKGRFENNEGNALGPWTGRPYAGDKTP